jgi:hypothetical protein
MKRQVERGGRGAGTGRLTALPARGLRPAAAALAAALLAGLSAAARASDGPADSGEASGPAVPAARDFDVGFLAARDTDLHGNRRLRMLGPFFERQTAPSGEAFTAVRPFFSDARGRNAERRVQDYLWPLGNVRDAGHDRAWRFLPAFGNDFDRRAADSRYRGVVFPFLFMGRDEHGEGYFAVFPLGGRIHEFLGRDRIVFALFPLYAYSAAGDLRTHSVLWPVFSRTRGEEVSRFRVFPLYGRSERDADWSKRFVLWPIWTSVDYRYADCTGGGFILFPVCGRIRLTDQETWMVAPPLFRWSRSERLTRIHAPWPLFQYSSGEVEQCYLWPLWGRREQGVTRTGFLLWPLGGTEDIRRPDYRLRRLRLVPFVYYESRTPAAGAAGAEPGGEGPDDVPAEAAGTASGTEAVGERRYTGMPSTRYFKLWPLASYLREGDHSRLSALALWPIKRTRGVEKNLAPFWTLYSHTAVGGASEHELLWGLFRRRHGPGGEARTSVFPLAAWGGVPGEGGPREWSLLMGLAGYRREGGRREYRLLYLLKFRPEADGAAEPAAEEAEP